MADFSALIQRIKDAVYENGVQAITGQILQDCLKDVVNTVNVAKQDGIYRVTVTVDNNTGVPSATARMDDDTYTLEFSFHNLKGQKGDKGDKGDTPVLTADSDGVIYSDGVMLTRVIKDTTDALTTRADSDHARAESDHARAETDHTDITRARLDAETATSEANYASLRANTAADNADAARAAIQSDLAAKQDVIPDLQQIRAGATDTVKYSTQSLTDAQKEQARTNIGAASDSEVSQLRSEVNGLENYAGMVDKTITFSNGYINTSGVINSSTLSRFSQPILLHAGETVVVGTRNTNITIIGSTSADSLAVGDSVTTLRKTSNINQFEIYKYTATADIKISICVIASDYFVYFLNTNGDITIASQLFTLEQCLKYVPLQDITNQGIDTPGKFYSINSKTLEDGQNWHCVSFDVLPGKRYSIRGRCGQSARLWNFLNANNVFISSSSDYSALSTKSETVFAPANAAKLLVNTISLTNENFCVIEEAKKIDAESVYVGDTKIKEYIDGQSNNNWNRLFGKTLVCCGDSITEGTDMPADGIASVPSIEMYAQSGSGTITPVLANAKMTYGYQIAERNGMVFCNAGVSGSTMEGIAGRAGFSLADGRYTKLPNSIDYLTIWFGWNDTAYGTLGTINDSTNGSFYGGYNIVMPYLINKYPLAKIALIVPFGTDVDHRQAVRLLANKWGVACFDMYQGGTPLYFDKEPSVGVDASVVAANKAKFQAVGAHPNYQGHTQLADMIEHFLRGI